MPPRRNNNNNNNAQGSGHQGGQHGGAQRGQNHANGRGNGGAQTNNQSGKWCSIHKSNSHNTAECKNNLDNRNDNTPQRPKITCTNCGKYGHKAADCRTKENNAWEQKRENQQKHDNQPKQEPKQSYTYPPYNPTYTKRRPSSMDWTSEVPRKDCSERVGEAVQNYCQRCNVQGHSGANCDDILNMHKTFHSTMWCRACNSKGHLADDCNNPIYKRCTKCAGFGHGPTECKRKLNPIEAYVRFAADGTGKRFVWGGDYLKEVHPSQRAQHAYDEARRNAMYSGVPLSWEEDAWYRRAIFEASQIFDMNPFLRAANKLGYSTPNNNAVPSAANSRTPPVQSYSQTLVKTPSSMKPTNSNHAAHRKAAIDKFRKAGATHQEIKDFEIYYDKKVHDSKTDLEKRITAKINSALSYRLCKANNWIRLNEVEIRSRQVLTQWKMDEVKYAMLRGATFWRDPRAVKALFDHQIPRCNKCQENGQMFDQWFSRIPVAITKQDILALYNDEDWGIFVGFQCLCCNDKEEGLFDYVACSETDLEGLPEEER